METTEKVFTESSTVLKIEYNPDSRAMTVTFKGGKRYNYNGVPPAIWGQAVEAKSIGSYLSSNIKGIYPFTPL